MIPGPIYKIHVVIWWSRARSDRHPPKAWHPRTDISWPHAQWDWHSPVRWRRGKALLTSSWQTRNTCPKLIVHQNHQRFPSQNWNPTMYIYICICIYCIYYINWQQSFQNLLNPRLSHFARLSLVGSCQNPRSWVSPWSPPSSLWWGSRSGLCP